MKTIFARLIPFIFLGIMIVLLILGLIALSYLLIVGAIVGLVLFALTSIKEKFFTKKPSNPAQLKHKSGRTIDHHDL